MTTSGTINTTDTAGDLIKDALTELGVIGANQEVRAADAALGIRRLNNMLKDWQNDGVNLWRITDATQDVPLGQHTVTISPRVLEVSDVRLVSVSPAPGCDCLDDDDIPPNLITSERLLNRMEWSVFARIPNKLASALPTTYVPVVTLDSFGIRLWPVAPQDITIAFTGFRVIEDVTALDQTIDVPQQYARTVMMNLAANLAPSFGRAGDANAIVTIREAARLYQIMRAADRPASYFMGSAGVRYA